MCGAAGGQAAEGDAGDVRAAHRHVPIQNGILLVSRNRPCEGADMCLESFVISQTGLFSAAFPDFETIFGHLYCDEVHRNFICKRSDIAVVTKK